MRLLALLLTLFLCSSALADVPKGGSGGKVEGGGEARTAAAPVSSGDSAARRRQGGSHEAATDSEPAPKYEVARRNPNVDPDATPAPKARAPANGPRPRAAASPASPQAAAVPPPQAVVPAGASIRPFQQPVLVREALVVMLPTGQPAQVPPGSVACTSAADCGAGTAGLGAVCDRASFSMGVGAVGICRDFCVDYNGCPSGSARVSSLDPDDDFRSGCVAQ